MIQPSTLPDIISSKTTKRMGRGIILYINQELNSQEISTSNFNIGSVWAKIKLNNKDELLFGCIYRSPNSGQDTIKEMGELLEINKTCGCSHLCIVGDFNFKEINWSTHTTNVSTSHQSTIFLEQVRDSFLTQHVTKPTRYREGSIPTVLDLIFTNEEYMVENIEFLPGLGKSDHFILEFEYICFSERVISKHQQLRSYKY